MAINEVELKHIIGQFHKLNMHSDLAMLFITQDITYDQLFDRFLSSDTKFYKKVFSYIFKYSTTQIDKGRLDKVFVDIVSKLDCMYYTKSLTYEDGMIERFGFSSRYLEGLLIYLLSDNDLNAVNSCIDMMAINPNINNRVIFEILSRHKELCHQYILSHLIANEYLGIEDIFKLILIRAEDLPLDDVRMLLQELFFNPSLLLLFAAHVFSFYRITVDYKSNKCMVELKCLLKGSEKVLLDNIREIIIETMWIDAELDYYDFLDNAYTTHRNSKNIHMTNLYNTYLQWFRSHKRDSESIGNFLLNGHEEDLVEMHLTYDNTKELSADIMNINYITDISGLEGYALFIKLFNMNRFLLGNYNNTYTAQRHLEPLVETESLAISLATSVNFYIFLCFR